MRIKTSLLIAIIATLTPLLPATAADNFPQSEYIPPDTVAIATLTPAQLLEYDPLYTALRFGAFFDIKNYLGPFSVEDLKNVERAIIAFDQNNINTLAASDGIPIPTIKQPRPAQLIKNLKQIAISMFDYEEAFKRLPRANGDASGESTGLSWRVHLLPYLNEKDLYSQFRLNEPWDSEHNKKLIPKMPKLFAVDSINQPGQTSIHVITGTNTVFPEDAKLGRLLKEIKDGPATTILAVVADPSTASEWTRPGGLKFDPSKPLECLGSKAPSNTWTILCDGSVQTLYSPIDPAAFSAFVTLNDGIQPQVYPTDEPPPSIFSLGLSIPGEPQPSTTDSMKQLGLAMHNYYDEHNRLPRANGDAAGKSTGLSWRVHILPYLEEGELYKQFHLDEAWDSPHNKKLISKMPKIFSVDGVDAPGKTSLHVITGSNTMFPENAKQGATFSDVLDGLSNTIMIVNAAPETAAEWTKPGGLKFDPKKPTSCLGKLPAAGNMITMGDGSATVLSPQIPGAVFTDCVLINDMRVVQTDWFQSPISGASNALIPTVVLTLKEPFQMNKLEQPSQKFNFGQQTLYDYSGWGVYSPSPKTLIVGETSSLQARLKAGTLRSTTPDKLVSQLDSTASISTIIDIQSQQHLLKQLVDKHPSFASILDYQQITQSFWLTDRKDGDLIMKTAVTFTTPETASKQVQGFNDQADHIKLFVNTLIVGKFNEPIRTILIGLATIKIEHSANIITSSITAPLGTKDLPNKLAPMFAKAKEAAEASQLMKNLQMIAVAFHSFHETYNHFPSTTSGANNAQKGLSWRVHLLPFLEESALYEQFHLNEPWDSEHNLKLAERMPDSFKSAGVTESNKTSIHLLSGEGTPFNKENSPHVRDFTDGLTKTILIINAAPEKAEIWTKPGGLEIDMEKPVRSLGDFKGQSTYYSLGDGSIQTLPPNFRASAMRNLIRHQDGK